MRCSALPLLQLAHNIWRRYQAYGHGSLLHHLFNLSTPNSISTAFRSRGQLSRWIPYLAPLSPRPWSQTMVALCVPLGLTTCVLPYSNGLFAPASNAYSFLYYTQSHLTPQRRKCKTKPSSNHQWKQSVPDARELLPPKLIPRTIAAPPHPLLATRPANAAITATTTTQQPTSGSR